MPWQDVCPSICPSTRPQNVKILNAKIFFKKLFVHRRHGVAKVASKEIFCYTSNFFQTVGSGLY